MSEQIKNPATHVDELLSGLLDGELTQQQRQRVQLHCEECPQCRATLEELRAVRERVGQSALSEIGNDYWRENMNDPMVKNAQAVGWVMLVLGLVIVTAAALVALLFGDFGFGEKLILILIYGGLVALFVSVARQRMIESKTDKYKDVEI